MLSRDGIQKCDSTGSNPQDTAELNNRKCQQSHNRQDWFARIVASVISVAAFGAACSALAETQMDEHAKRQAALTWAISQRQAALRAVLERRHELTSCCRSAGLSPFARRRSPTIAASFTS